MIYIEGSALFSCLLRLPENYAPDICYPLVVGLAGGGGNPEDLIKLWDHIPGREFIYAVPRAPYPMLVDGELGFDWALWPTGDEELIGRATELSEQYIIKVAQIYPGGTTLTTFICWGFLRGQFLPIL